MCEQMRVGVGVGVVVGVVVGVFDVDNGEIQALLHMTALEHVDSIIYAPPFSLGGAAERHGHQRAFSFH